MMKIEDLEITQENVNEFFDEINVGALVDSLKLTFKEQNSQHYK